MDLPAADAPMQLLVFALVAAAFTNVYITQPVLPVLQQEFGSSASRVSLTMSAVIFGMAVANLPFGALADMLAVRWLILSGGLMVAVSGLICALTHNFWLLVTARGLQGLFIPALTTCLAAYLAVNVPPSRLNVVMGSYVSATVAGGLGGRLLGGFIHPPLHWRYAFVTAAAALLAATLAAVLWLPNGRRPPRTRAASGFRQILTEVRTLRLLLVPFGAFFVFSSSFNYLPFYLAGPPFLASTQLITLMYLTYLMGIVVGPLAGRLSNRLGNGLSMLGGAAVFALALLATLVPHLVVIVLALLGLCLGFFTIHAAAAGALNRRVSSGQGKANSLYVLFYYLGGALGITLNGYAYGLLGWPGVVGLGIVTLVLPAGIGFWERRES
ncbi:MAG: MFS transporter [Desulfobacca sp.]|uniref:MFS transporter n=1 Tax=Desulfobacca sp. TaxID=2067990 RepID=UPI004049B86E